MLHQLFLGGAALVFLPLQQHETGLFFILGEDDGTVVGRAWSSTHVDVDSLADDSVDWPVELLRENQ